MKRTLLFLTLLFSSFSITHAQQDLFSNLTFHTIVANPAYAGAKEQLNVTLSHFDQWVRFDGGPNEQTLSLHSKLRNPKFGIGGSIVHSNIGFSRNYQLNGHFARHILLNNDAILSFGLTGSYNHLNRAVTNSGALVNDVNFFNVGIGAFYNTKRFYIGISIPKLINEVETANGTVFVSSQYHLMGGLMIPIKEKWAFKPSFLVNNKRIYAFDFSMNSPLQISLDGAITYKEKVWFGSTYQFQTVAGRDIEQLKIWGAYGFKNGLKLGLSYGEEIGPLLSIFDGPSMQLVVGYVNNKKKVETFNTF